MKLTQKPGTFTFVAKDPKVILPLDISPQATWQQRLMKDNSDNEKQYTALLDQNKWADAIAFKKRTLDNTQRLIRLFRPNNSNATAWVKSAPKIQSTASSLVRALSPRSIVRWHIPNGKKTEHAVYDQKTQRWRINLDPRRLKYPNALATKATEPDRIMIQAAIGGALHETAHALHSPANIQEVITTYEQNVVKGVYEDLYVNARLLRRLPGAQPFLASACAWNNPPANVRAHYQELLKEKPQFFEEWFAIQGVLDFIVNWALQVPSVTVPYQEIIDHFEAIKPYSDKLTSGDPIPEAERAQMYQEIADIITRNFPPLALAQLPNLHSDNGNPEDQGQQNSTSCGDTPGEPSGQETPGQQQSPGNSNAGTRTPLDQPIGPDSRINFREVAETQFQCMHHNNSAAPEQGTTDAAAAQQLNDQLDNREEDNVSVAGINYNQPHNGRTMATPKTDGNVVDRIKKIFRTRNSERRNYVHGMPEGKLSTRRLHKLVRPSVDKLVFKSRPRIDSVNTAVLFLVDASGSMNGSPYNTAITATQTIYEALKDNKDYKLLVWTYSGSPEMVDVMSAIRKGEITWPSLWGGGTPSYSALGKAHQHMLANYKNSKRVILHFTDAAPGDDSQSAAEAMEKLKKDKATAYASIAVAPPEYMNHLIKHHPDLHIMNHPITQLVEAVHEFIINHAN